MRLTSLALNLLALAAVVVGLSSAHCNMRRLLGSFHHMTLAFNWTIKILTAFTSYLLILPNGMRVL